MNHFNPFSAVSTIRRQSSGTAEHSLTRSFSPKPRVQLLNSEVTEAAPYHRVNNSALAEDVPLDDFGKQADDHVSCSY